MPDFLSLSREEQADIITAAAAQTGKNPVVLQKDFWVCWCLQVLFTIPDRVDMAFKGGTSLSKVFNAIHRFSEDVDVTLDYRNWGEELDPFSTTSRTQQKKRLEELKARVAQYVQEVIRPQFEKVLSESIGDDGVIEVSGGDGEELYIHYPSVLEARLDYIDDKVFVEFGGRNITEPKEIHTIKPYLSEIAKDLTFPSAQVDVLSPKRTFWEKATLIHVECNRDREAAPEGISRHWYDVAMLLGGDIGKEALADIALLQDVVHCKKMFFASSYANYDACLEGGFKLIPVEPLLSSLADDYGKMVSSGMFDVEPPSFEEIVQVMMNAQEKINSAPYRAWLVYLAGINRLGQTFNV